MVFLRLAALGVLCIAAYAQPSLAWRLTRSNHFELYSQADDTAARSALVWFEQLRVFYLQKTGLDPESLPPVRVIAFGSAREYQPYRLHAASDAHFIGTNNRDYIVMETADAGQFGVAAHEYAHSILHAAGLEFPPWFAEGLADFFSTVRIGERGCTLGGDLPSRSQTLRGPAWIPLADLLAMPKDSPLRNNRDTASVFYAQSWALTEMLVVSPEYAPRYSALIAALASGTADSTVLASVYGKSLDAITRDLHAWTATKHQPVSLPGIEVGQIAVQPSEEVSAFRSRELMADLLLAAGALDRAEALYLDLSREAPENAGVSAALGAVALRRGDQDRAREHWKRAIDQGIQDAKLCYQYAVLGENADLPDSELRPALERAVTLKPDFDDARYHLALLEKRGGQYEAAVTQLRAMRNVAPSRAYSYWIAMAGSLLELDRRDEARTASKRAAEHATTAEQRSRAAQLAYFADTDLTVQFMSGANGRAELATTRVPHHTPNWNPFIEPGDQIRHVEGALRKIDCSGPATLFTIDTSAGPITLAVADPGHVQMRNAPAEFVCGPQKTQNVAVDYAISRTPGRGPAGLVRGMQFK